MVDGLKDKSRDVYYVKRHDNNFYVNTNMKINCLRIPGGPPTWSEGTKAQALNGLSPWGRPFTWTSPTRAFSDSSTRSPHSVHTTSGRDSWVSSLSEPQLGHTYARWHLQQLKNLDTRASTIVNLKHKNIRSSSAAQQTPSELSETIRISWLIAKTADSDRTLS